MRAMVSPCPHTPGCPPPVCLAPGLRPQGTTWSTARPVHRPVDPDHPGGPATGGYDVHTGYVKSFAGVMGASADGVEVVERQTPRFEGWNLVPLAGIPIVGVPFAGRFNTIADTWRDSAGILADMLRTDSGKVSRAADNYHAAETAGAVQTA
ncbi:hypothetical protein [Nonomuraea sp. NPDC048916]|uniref:hypothetical protein n=1 Tax=Nonomuraea sp. NPDC048916 TaxID=3154232 RepID=UPI0033D2868B